jgi:hypothetical protein
MSCSGLTLRDLAVRVVYVWWFEDYGWGHLHLYLLCCHKLPPPGAAGHVQTRTHLDLLEDCRTRRLDAVRRQHCVHIIACNCIHIQQCLLLPHARKVDALCLQTARPAWALRVEQVHLWVDWQGAISNP